MYSTCSVSPELSWKDVDPTPWIEYVQLSPNSSMHANYFSFMLEIAPLNLDMFLEAPLSIIHVSSPMMRDSDKAETR